MSTVIQDDDIEIIHESYPTSPIYWRPTTWDDAEWQPAGLRCADVIGGWQDDDNVIKAVRAQIGND